MRWTKCPNDAFVLVAERRIRFGDVTVMLAIASYRNGATGACFPSIDSVAFMLAVSRQTVRRAISRLENVGLIVVSPRKGRGRLSSQYDFPWLSGPTTSGTAKGYHMRPTPLPPVVPPALPPVVPYLEDEVTRDKRGASAKKEQDEPRALTEEEVIPRFGEVTHHHVVSGGFCIRCKEAVS